MSTHREHKTFFGKIFGSACDWLKDQFEAANHDLLEVAINITQLVNDGLKSGVLDGLVSFTSTKIDDAALDLLRTQVPIFLAEELALKNINSATPDTDVRDILTEIVDAFGGLSDDKKEKLYTSVAASAYKLLMLVKEGKKVTFGQAAAMVETAYQAYLKSKEPDTTL